MGEIKDGFASTFRPFEVDGVPSSGPHQPVKADIIALGGMIEASISFSALGIATVQTSADLKPPAATDPKLTFVLTGDDAGLKAYVNGAWVDYQNFYAQLAQAIQPYIDQIEDVQQDFAASIAKVSSLLRYVTVPGFLFCITDTDGKMVVSVDTSGVMTVNGVTIGSTASGPKFRLYTWEERDGPNWRLRGYEGTDGVHFPTELNITYTGLPSGLTVRDPKVLKVGGKYLLVHTAYGFGTGSGAAQFAVATSDDGLNFTFVRLVSMSGFVSTAQTAWAPDLAVDPSGAVLVMVSCWLGQTETNPSGSGQYVLKPYLVAPTTPDFAGAWKLIGPVTGAGIPNNSIDGSLAFYNGFANLVIKNESTKRLRYLWSTSAVGPYDSYVDLSLGNEDTEGPDLRPDANGRFNLLYDRNASTGLGVSVSTDFGKTYSTYAPVTTAVSNTYPPRHGSIVQI